MRDRAHRIRAQPARPRRSGAAPDAAVAAVLGLQRGAGNAAVTGLIRASRRAIQRQPKTHTFELGKDVSVDLAKKAKSLAKDGAVTPDELPALQTLALKDEDRRRRGTHVHGGAPRHRERRPARRGRHQEGQQAHLHLRVRHHRGEPAHGGRRGPRDGPIGARTRTPRPRSSSPSSEPPGRAGCGPSWPSGRRARGRDQCGVLPAMLAAASDSTPDDMLAAATVYTVAASAKHPLTADIRAGNVKVDAVSKVPARKGHPSEAIYTTHGAGRPREGRHALPQALRRHHQPLPPLAGDPRARARRA